MIWPPPNQYLDPLLCEYRYLGRSSKIKVSFCKRFKLTKVCIIFELLDVLTWMQHTVSCTVPQLWGTLAYKLQIQAGWSADKSLKKSCSGEVFNLWANSYGAPNSLKSHSGWKPTQRPPRFNSKQVLHNHELTLSTAAHRRRSSLRVV